jgi:nicotinamidase/pyrazinamidase
MKTVFLDVDTQIDFVFPAGALYVPGAELVLPNIAALNRYAAVNGVALISTADAHSENDPEFRTPWHPHCIVGTVGQAKPASTLVGQTIVEKQVYDMFAKPLLDEMLDRIGAERYVVYGVVTEVCVRCAVTGLVRRGAKRIEVISDAIRHFDAARGQQALDEFTASGAVLRSTADILA